ncbi:hypothetical protein BPORC_2062 [Bifidobacterium porcinum]|nr:hypothetical protein BPORC_2062 [Bifidobacterium porcinum]
MRGSADTCRSSGDTLLRFPLSLLSLSSLPHIQSIQLMLPMSSLRFMPFASLISLIPPPYRPPQSDSWRLNAGNPHNTRFSIDTAVRC